MSLVRRSPKPGGDRSTSRPSAAPGWYADPWNPHYQRWYDGQHWTGGVRKQPHKPIIGPLLIVAGIALALYFLLTHPSVNVPLAGSQDCGGASWRVGTVGYSASADSSGSLVDALNQECVSEGRRNMLWAGGSFVIALIAGVMVTRYEQTR